MNWTEAQLRDYGASRMVRGEARRHAGQRRGKPARDRPPAADEQAVHFAVVDHLRLRAQPGVTWWHHPAGELRDAATGAKLRRMGAKTGLPDLLILAGGQLFGLELKREHGGSVSADQKRMHAELRASGAIVEVAHGVDDALALLASWGVISR